MDDIVKQAIAKWPNVPDCFGWMGLDARGRWYMRDDATQAAGTFPQSRGSLLLHEKLIAFIERNYEADEQGHWFFQNGPQRVYVELEATPWVWRVDAVGQIHSHTGQSAEYRACVIDESGYLYLETDLGLGIVHTLDMEYAADAVDRGEWSPQEKQAADLPNLYGFVCHPSK